MAEKKHRRGDKRRFPRLSLRRKVRAKAGGREYEGQLQNISAGGAAVRGRVKVKPQDLVHLDIEDFSPLPGRVTRASEDGFAVAFEYDDDDVERIMEEIGGLNRPPRQPED